MSALLVLGASFVTLVLAVVAVAVTQQDLAHRRSLIAAVDAQTTGPTGALDRLDMWLVRRRWGTRFTALLAGSGLGAYSPALLLLVAAAATLVVSLVTNAIAGRVAAVVAAVFLVMFARRWLDNRRQARVERFIGQLPELARLLANGAQAGLGLRRSLELASREMDEPASSELAQIASEMGVGQSATGALRHLSERLPSRELVVLVQTLAIQSRSGGALVTALQRIAETLDERRQLRREITTATVGAQFSGYAVAGIAAGAVVLMNVMSPGVLDVMFGSVAGQVALAVAGGLFAIGFVVVRRLSKVDL